MQLSSLICLHRIIYSLITVRNIVYYIKKKTACSVGIDTEKLIWEHRCLKIDMIYVKNRHNNISIRTIHFASIR